MMHDPRLSLKGAHDPLAVQRRLEREAAKADMVAWLRGQAAARDGARFWFVVAHRGSGESLAAEMRAEGIEAWCPMDVRKKRVGKNKRMVDVSVPLLPGYIFVKTLAFEAAHLAVMTFGGVVGLVGDGVKPMPVSDEEVRKIKAYGATPIAQRAVLYPDGCRILVCKGSFAGFEGVVLRSETDHGRVKVECDVFRRATIVDLDIDMIDLL